jgi:hypothetical protein
MKKIVQVLAICLISSTSAYATSGAAHFEHFLNLQSKQTGEIFDLLKKQTDAKFDLEKKQHMGKMSLEEKHKRTHLDLAAKNVNKLGSSKDQKQNDAIFTQATKEAIATRKNQGMEWATFMMECERDEAELMKKFNRDFDKLHKKHERELADLEARMK